MDLNNNYKDHVNKVEQSPEVHVATSVMVSFDLATKDPQLTPALQGSVTVDRLHPDTTILLSNQRRVSQASQVESMAAEAVVATLSVQMEVFFHFIYYLFLQVLCMPTTTA